jgi:flagellar biosynthesis protein fliQ
MILGIVIAIFQAATSINEQTLTFVPKLIAIIIMMTVLGGTLLKTMQDFFTMIMKMVAGG